MKDNNIRRNIPATRWENPVTTIKLCLHKQIYFDKLVVIETKLLTSISTRCKTLDLGTRITKNILRLAFFAISCTQKCPERHRQIP
jgi:hypothetical protein